MSKSGVYIAWGAWLDGEYGPGQLHKVGHTGSLGRRLNDSAYVTCFPPGHWRYVATFELASKEEAFLLETAVLHCCRARRLGASELVRGTAEELIGLAERAAKALGLNPTRRDKPTYPAVRGAGAGAGASGARDKKPGEPAEPTEPSAWQSKKGLVDGLSLPPPGSPRCSKRRPPTTPSTSLSSRSPTWPLSIPSA